MNPIKKVFNFLLLFEIICFFIMILELIESNFDLRVPIYIALTDEIVISSSFQLNWLSIMAFFITIAVIYVLSSLNILTTGLIDEGAKSVKDIVSFLVVLILMIQCVNYVLLKSTLLMGFITLIDIIIMVFHLLNFLKGADNE